MGLKMKVKIFADGLGEYERPLREAITIINGAQRYFRLDTEIVMIELPKGDYIEPKQARDFIESKYTGNDFKVCITGRPFPDNWFSHEYRKTSIITVSDWEQIYAPPSLRCYIIYEISHALVKFAANLSEEMVLSRFAHEPARGCMLDMCVHKPDIKLGMIAGNLCLQCKGLLLQYGVNTEAIDAIERILRHVRAEAIGRPLIFDPNSAFVVMRFTQNDENDNAYEYGIKPGLEAVGLRVERADNIVTSSQILDKIKRYIDRCRFIVAKVDENNLNVYFELGLAMGCDKEVLLISERELVLKLPSDLRNWECLTYTKGNYKELKEKVIKFFEDNYGLNRIR